METNASGLQMFLRGVVSLLLKRSERKSSAVSVGRDLPLTLQAWLREQDLRLCSLLALYSKDFNICRIGRSNYMRYRHESPKVSYVMDKLAGDENGIVWF
eukprot:TRINITY_DN12512_c0_g1_i2.p3 TRINITY_DN12512_c0_g1~~TRINITY_DN12512_c0_g1_i2.p3  ORF type:complete len:100 (-),score=21.74 TRINITY_DN12512_c0_g1_i2:439-738(-)